MIQKENGNPLRTFRRALPLICLLLAAAYLIFNDISLQQLLSYTPKTPLLAALFLLLLYALKSISVVFPVILLQIAAGHLFSPIPALLVNTVGMLISLLIPYGIGRCSGSGAIEKLEHKHPKIAAFAEKQKAHMLFLNFFLRIISVLPADIVSIYFGSVKAPILSYLGGGILGMLPGMIAVTFLGASITDPGSPTFVLSAAGTVLLAAGSLIVYWIMQKKQSK